MRRILPGLVALALVIAGCSGGEGDSIFDRVRGNDPDVAAASRARVDVRAYEGLGTWVDVYDYVPEFQDRGEVPAVTPRRAMSAIVLGVTAGTSPRSWNSGT